MYIHTNDNDLITLNPYVFVDVLGFTQNVSCTNCICVYIHTNDNDLITLIPFVFVDATWIHTGSKFYQLYMCVHIYTLITITLLPSFLMCLWM